MSDQIRAMEMTTEEARLLAQFVADYNGGVAEDYMDGDEIDSSGDMTRDEFACFDGRGWKEWEGQEFVQVGGHNAVHYEKVQAFRGQPRYALWVIDLGDFRAVYQM
jgi:hypothetical protein